jgi:hypothetical protein
VVVDFYFCNSQLDAVSLISTFRLLKKIFCAFDRLLKVNTILVRGIDSLIALAVVILIHCFCLKASRKELSSLERLEMRGRMHVTMMLVELGPYAPDD